MAPRRDRVLLLRRFRYGESSLVVHALSAGHGRVHLMARGAYRPRSRYYALLDLFDTLELEWDARPGRDLHELRAGALVTRRAVLSRDLARYRAATTVLELADLCAREGTDAPALFGLGERALDALADGAEPARALLLFELRLLRAIGLEPALARCAACAGPAVPVREGDAEDGPRAAFSAGAGGRLCAGCAAEAHAAGRRVGTLPVRLLDAAAKLIEEGGAGQWDAAAEVRLGPGELLRTRDLVARFLEYHLAERPRTYRSLLSVPNRNQARAHSHPAAP